MPSFKCLLNGDFSSSGHESKLLGMTTPLSKRDSLSASLTRFKLSLNLAPLRKVNPVASTSMSVNCAIRDTIGM